MPRLRRPSDMCSRTVSDTANTRIHERTQCVSAEEKILCRSPYFAAVTCRQSAPDPLRERGNSQEGGNRRCLPSCAPARRQRTPLPRGAARSRRPQTANPPLDFKQKTPRPLGANTLTQFVRPVRSVQRKRLPPGKGEPPARFRSPDQPVQKKEKSRRLTICSLEILF